MSHREVIKIGGSLLASPGAMAAVARWLRAERRAGSTRWVLAGGGPVVDGLRAIDRANPIDPAESHWAAVRMMDASTGLLSGWLAGLEGVEKAIECSSHTPGDYAIQVLEWLRDCEPKLPGERLTIGWQTTSDAIAARLAACLDADLTLLKYGSIKTYADLAEAAADGVVDPETPRVAPPLQRVRVVAVPLTYFSDFPAAKLDAASSRDSTH